MDLTDISFLRQFEPGSPRRLTREEYEVLTSNYITYVDGIPVLKVNNPAPAAEYQKINSVLESIWEKDYQDKTGWAKETSHIDPLNAISTAHYNNYNLHHEREFNWLNEQVFHYANMFWRFLGMTSDWELNLNDCWANRHLEGGTTGLHFHPQRHISVAYYMSVPENSGDFYFRTLNEQIWFNWPNEIGWDEGYDEWAEDRGVIKGIKYHYPMNVKTGDLMLWPSFMKHETGINKSTDPRVVISYNLRAIHKAIYRVEF